MASNNISISNAAYNRLKKRKEPGDSFSDVILREVPEPLDTAGEVVDYFQANPVPGANRELRSAMLAGRGRRSNRKP